MKKLFSLIVMLAMVTTISFAQDKTPVQVDEPQITFESLEVDYGTIEHNSDPLRVFKFTNSGENRLLFQMLKVAVDVRYQNGQENLSWPVKMV